MHGGETGGVSEALGHHTQRMVAKRDARTFVSRGMEERQIGLHNARCEGHPFPVHRSTVSECPENWSHEGQSVGQRVSDRADVDGMGPTILPIV